MEIGNQRMKLGKSILVPSVKELANGSFLDRVPDRYVHQNQEPAYYGDGGELQVPIINMEALLIEDKIELEKLDSACKDWGFFQVINHGIDKSLVEKFKTETQDFFNLPLEEKKKYWQTSTEVEGYGQAFVTSEDQKLDWCDMFFLTTLPKHLRKPNLLPALPPSYRDTLELYSAKLQNLAMKLIDSMSKALKIDPNIMKSIFDNGTQSIRMNYYPPCPQPDKAIGLTPHSDGVGLTILLQFDETEGLQINKDGKWVPIKPLPDAFVVNIGDIVELITNGIYRSIVHRAVVNAENERISVAAFHNPSLDVEIGPIPHLIKPDNPARFKRISVADYFKGLFARPLDKKSYLDLMRINENES